MKITARSAGSIRLRLPFQIRKVERRWVARIAADSPIGFARPPVRSPAIAVTVAAALPPCTAAVSQTAQADSGLPDSESSSGMPGMPIMGPVGYLVISADVTHVGDPALPVANRADVRFSAGRSRPSIFA